MSDSTPEMRAEMRKQIETAIVCEHERLGMCGAWSPQSATALLDERDRLERERDEAHRIIRDTLWMARRYADGRQSYAVGMYNDAAKKALSGGIVEDHGREPMFAHDSMGARYAGLTQEQHDQVVAHSDQVCAAEDSLAAERERTREMADALEPFGSVDPRTFRPSERIMDRFGGEDFGRAARVLADYRRSELLRTSEGGGGG